MSCSGDKDSCRQHLYFTKESTDNYCVGSRRTFNDLFVIYEMLTNQALYIFPVVVLVKENENYTMVNSNVNDHNQRQRPDF